MHANEANYDCTNRTDSQTSIFECIWHGQNSRSDISFQQMNHRVTVSVKVEQTLFNQS